MLDDEPIGPALGDAQPTAEDGDSDAEDVLGELRVLLPMAQLLTAFLIAVPFAPGFANTVRTEKHVFLATFMLSVASLVLLTGPAVQHRLMRLLGHRGGFRKQVNRQILLGAALLAAALVLATRFVLSEVLGHQVGNIAAAAMLVLIAATWLLLPFSRRGRSP
ncbi:MAG: hypothetical protein E6Q67_01955 [Roseateles sp.]|nr:MAG: hypothetical protein E6Q67_01955 [Roseateles sp.]